MCSRKRSRNVWGGIVAGGVRGRGDVGIGSGGGGVVGRSSGVISRGDGVVWLSE